MPPSYIRVRAVVWAYGRGQTDTQTDTQTRVTTIHFASSTTHAKCKNPSRMTKMLKQWTRGVPRVTAWAMLTGLSSRRRYKVPWFAGLVTKWTSLSCQSASSRRQQPRLQHRVNITTCVDRLLHTLYTARSQRRQLQLEGPHSRSHRPV